MAAAVALLAIPGSAGQAWSQEYDYADGEDILEPGYILNVVIPEPGTTGERTVTIDEHGEVSLGFYGRVPVGGMTLDEARRALRRHLAEYVRGTSGVDVTIEARQHLVRVSGLVEEPGWVAVGVQADPWFAIQEAGGPTEGADLSRIAVIRQGGEERIVDLRGYLTRQRRDTLPELESLDEIVVPAVTGMSAVAGQSEIYLDAPQMASSVVILGAVQSPGVYHRPRGLSALAALGLADGPEEDADLANVRLITDNGSRRLDLEGNLVGNGFDAAQLPRDGMAIIYVPARRDNEPNPFSRGVSVIGAVTAPRYMEMARSVPFLEAVALAGGPDQDADLEEVRHVRIRNGYSISSHYNMEEYFEDGGELETVVAEPGDVIMFEPGGDGGGETFLRAVSAATVIGSAVLLSLTLSDELSE